MRLDGDVWSARAFDDKQEIEPGAEVTIVEISGRHRRRARGRGLTGVRRDIQVIAPDLLGGRGAA